jgi:hypothetical protein
MLLIVEYSRTGPRNAIDRSEQLAHHFIRPRLALQHLVGEQLQRRREAHMRQLLGQVGLQRRIGRRRLHLGRIDRGMPGEDRDRVADLEAGRLARPPPWLPDRRCAAAVLAGATRALPGVLPSHCTCSCWPGISRGYGIQARTVSPAGTASAFTVSDWVNSMRCGSTEALPLCSAAASTRVVRVEHFVGPGAGIGASARRRARASSLSRNRFDGARLKYQRVPSMSDARSGRAGPSARIPRRSDRESSAARQPWRRLRRGKIQADAAHALALERDVVETDARFRRVGRDQAFSRAWASENRPASHRTTAQTGWPGGRLRARRPRPQQQRGTQAGGSSRRGLRTAGSTATLPQRGW